MRGTIWSALALAALGLAGAAPAAGGGGDGGGKAAPERAYVVVLRNGVELGQAVRDARRRGAEVLHVYGHALNGFAASLTAREAAELRRDRRVAYLTVDREFRLAGQTTPTGVSRVGARPAPEPSLARKVGRAAAGVAVIDTGVDLDHPDLGIVVPGRNCVTLSRLPDDDHGHGTHVAGTIAALDDDSGVVGVAPGATLYAVKVFNATGGGSLSSVLCGVDWVTAHAAVIRVANMSLGSAARSTPSSADCSNGNTDALHTAICRSTLAGVTYVVAAGNDGDDAAKTVPAAYEEVIAVSALSDSDGAPAGLGPAPTCLSGEEDDRFASYSNYGPVVDIAAPGTCIYSTSLNGGYATKSGTSMAAPHVSGAAARYLAARPTATPAEVRAALLAAWEPGPIPGDPDQFAEGVVRVTTTTALRDPSAPVAGIDPVPAAPTVPAIPPLPQLPPVPGFPLGD